MTIVSQADFIQTHLDPAPQHLPSTLTQVNNHKHALESLLRVKFYLQAAFGTNFFYSVQRSTAIFWICCVIDYVSSLLSFFFSFLFFLPDYARLSETSDYLASEDNMVGSYYLFLHNVDVVNMLC